MPSRNIDATCCHLLRPSRGRSSLISDQLVPLSNQTSIVSLPRRYCEASSAGSTQAASSAASDHQASIPRSEITAIICLTLASVSTASPVSLWYSAGMGTPQDRCLEIHHSLLLCTKLRSLDCPEAGRKSTLSSALRACSLIVLRSANHWAVARTRIGFLVLQS